MKCDICGNNYGRQGGSFNKHLKSVHNINSYLEYFVLINHNGIRPICGCGCGEETALWENKFKEFKHGHNKILDCKILQNSRPNNEILSLYLNGFSGEQISIRLNLCKGYVYNIIRGANIVRDNSNARRKFKIDDSVFEIIDTEDKAYWLGFLYADGYNNTNKNSVSLCLNIKDIDTLEKFSHFLQTDKKIRFNNNRSKKVVIENKKISRDLENLGMVKAKTHLLRFPSIPQDLERHFIRGYFDGDGCITYGNVISSNANISIVSTIQFLREIESRIGIHFSYNKRHKDRKDDIYTLTTGGVSNLMIFYDFLYKNSTVYMGRKKSKFDDWFKYYFSNTKIQSKTLELKNKLNI